MKTPSRTAAWTLALALSGAASFSSAQTAPAPSGTAQPQDPQKVVPDSFVGPLQPGYCRASSCTSAEAPKPVESAKPLEASAAKPVDPNTGMDNALMAMGPTMQSTPVSLSVNETTPPPPSEAASNAMTTGPADDPTDYKSIGSQILNASGPGAGPSEGAPAQRTYSVSAAPKVADVTLTYVKTQEIEKSQTPILEEAIRKASSDPKLNLPQDDTTPAAANSAIMNGNGR